MFAATRALMLAVPMVAFAIGGGFYAPPKSGTGTADAALSSLPSLPAWADNDLPEFSGYSDTTEKKAAFFSFLYPRIVLANSRILLQRDYLASLNAKDALSDSELAWLDKQSKRLRVKAEPGSQAQLSDLKQRLDVIPPSLILAQAANESAWGTSRFARAGNNLFGQWCFTKGCGLVPQHRPEGASHEVKAFASPYHSIRAYMENLNRHNSYQVLRDIRLEARNAGNPLSGLALAGGLVSYSERGEAYVGEIRSMIRYNNLTYYDKEFRNILSDRSPSKLKNLASADAEQVLLPGYSAEG
ncbi:bax protein [Marinobacter adhaerens]|uniref:Bax protein n=1 Tax=Marinobacter adhaerens TaxID=1033846 RepID=A0A851HQW4_9GAMM|nr:glucosaminidase domain-containing protein [Marinobacter adhaerens]NWN91347.1 bax protein [Marinobacter adhaerens]